MTRHPIQPLVTDANGTVRFKENAIVRYLLDHGPFDLNMLAIRNFSDEDREQFAQLIGYSLAGAGDLDYFSDLTWTAAEEMERQGISSDEARRRAAEKTLASVREGMRDAVAELYSVHPDDLGRHLE